MFQEKFTVTPAGIPNDGILFVDHQKNNRSGHLGHALVEYAPSQILAFHPNCSAEDTKFNGHSGYGWMEYKRSTDGGQTWSAPIIEPNSKALFDEGCGRSLMCEKAVCTDTGRIILFYLQCDMLTHGHIWEPYFCPQYAVSDDQGDSFGLAQCFTRTPGRILDALVLNGTIYVLFQEGAYPSWENQIAPLYLYTSEDDGESFTLRSEIPFVSTKDTFYGTMTFMPNSDLIVYTYDEDDEYNLKYNISHDCGHTWEINRRAFFAKRLRNPQIVYFGDTYIMHGRSGSHGKECNRGHFILYTSPDGIHWDEGHYLRMRVAGAGAYSNNLIVHLPDGTERLMIQSSFAYEQHKTNVIMYWLDKKQ